MAHKILKRNELCSKLGIGEGKINVLTKEDGLPKPIALGKISGWVESEVDAWIDSKIAERDSAGEVA